MGRGGGMHATEWCSSFGHETTSRPKYHADPFETKKMRNFWMLMCKVKAIEVGCSASV